MPGIRKIDKNHFKNVLALNNKKQRDIVEMLGTTEAYFSRKLAEGRISELWFEKICIELNVSSDYLSGKSDDEISRVEEQTNMLRSKFGVKKLLNLFMAANRFYIGEELCEGLTDTDLKNISLFISYVAITHYDIKHVLQDLYGMDSIDEDKKEMQELQNKLDKIKIVNDFILKKLGVSEAELSEERSDKKKPAAAKNKNKK